MEVTLRSLSKYFSKVKAVDDSTLKIKDGEFVALLGPSGCGKTTTLFMVAGIYKPTKGYIYFDDEMVNEVLSKDRDIGMVFQSYALYPHMSVFDNIIFPLKLKKVPKTERAKKAKEVAELLRIEELLKRKPGELSGGQQQRVALARALAKGPKVLLLDEPLSNLDARLRIMMRSELKRLQKKLGITTIFVTHDQLEAMTMADRIAVMKEGRLQQFSTPEELYDLPHNLFVASFIGSPPMNLIDANVVRVQGKLWLKTKDFKFALPEETAYRLEKNLQDSEVILGIRPEDVRIESNGIGAEIYVVEPLGREVLVSLKVGEEILKVLVSKPFNYRMGDKVGLKLNTHKIHLFDRKTERSLLV